MEYGLHEEYFSLVFSHFNRGKRSNTAFEIPAYLWTGGGVFGLVLSAPASIVGAIHWIPSVHKQIGHVGICLT